MSDALLFVLLVLGAFRLWRLVGKDDITEPLRRPLPNLLLKGLTCAWCAGTWTAVGVTYAVHRYVVDLDPWLLWAGAVAALVGLIGDKVDTDSADTDT